MSNSKPAVVPMPPISSPYVEEDLRDSHNLPRAGFDAVHVDSAVPVSNRYKMRIDTLGSEIADMQANLDMIRNVAEVPESDVRTLELDLSEAKHTLQAWLIKDAIYSHELHLADLRKASADSGVNGHLSNDIMSIQSELANFRAELDELEAQTSI